MPEVPGGARPNMTALRVDTDVRDGSWRPYLVPGERALHGTMVRVGLQHPATRGLPVVFQSLIRLDFGRTVIAESNWPAVEAALGELSGSERVLSPDESTGSYSEQAELVRELNTDPFQWAESYAAKNGGDVTELVGWFAHAMDVGKKVTIRRFIQGENPGTTS